LEERALENNMEENQELDKKDMEDNADEILENEVNRMTKTLFDPEVEKRGIEKGIAEGIEKGKAELLIKLLIKKFKSLQEEYEDKIMNLPINAIDKIGMDIFDINSVEELEEYFKI